MEKELHKYLVGEFIFNTCCIEANSEKEMPQNVDYDTDHDRYFYFMMTGELVCWDCVKYFDNIGIVLKKFGSKIQRHVDNICWNLKIFIRQN